MTMTFSDYLKYGLLGIPLAFGALPLYMHVPKVYAENTSLSLAAIGIMLWLSRGIDAITDPWFGQLAQRINQRRLMLVSLLFFVITFYALCHPPAWQGFSISLWFLVTLTLTGVSFSAASIAYQTWGAGLGKNSLQRSQLVLSREILTLIAVIIAAVLPTLIGDSLGSGLRWLSWLLMLILAAVMLLAFAVPTNKNSDYSRKVSFKAQFAKLWATPRCRWLLIIFFVNGTASAIPATLFFFYVEDVLGAVAQSGYFLVMYFIIGVLTMAIWNKSAIRYGRVLVWQAAMLLAIVAFSIAGLLGVGDTTAFFLVCAFSGAALGADLCLPAAMAADCGEQEKMSGALFGWWNLLTKLNLAIAGGIALPVLAIFGFEVGAGADNTLALKVAYVLLPIAIKVLAWILLAKHSALLKTIDYPTSEVKT